MMTLRDAWHWYVTTRKTSFSCSADWAGNIGTSFPGMGRSAETTLKGLESGAIVTGRCSAWNISTTSPS